MFTLQQAQDAAAFANAHDGGVPQPRAEVVECNVPGRYAVKVRSLTLCMSGGKRWTEVEADTVYTRQGLAAVLGY